MKEPIPKLEPLVENLHSLSIGDFLISREFKRYCIKAGLDEYWRGAYEDVKRSRKVISLEVDYEKYDSLDALNILLNNLYLNYNDQFFFFIRDFLGNLAQWYDDSFDTVLIVEDLDLLNTPVEIIDYVKSLDNSNKDAVPRLEIPSTISDSEKLQSCLEKMDKSIRDTNFNLTLTYAYSCLEGIFKAYIIEKIPEEKNEKDLSKISKIVKNHLKQHFEENDKIYPEQMLNLIGTITNAISNARNNFSESHFDKTSDKWLAEFARDSVNTVARLILKFIK